VRVADPTSRRVTCAHARAIEVGRGGHAFFHHNDADVQSRETTDERRIAASWAPLDGRNINGGVRIVFGCNGRVNARLYTKRLMPRIGNG